MKNTAAYAVLGLGMAAFVAPAAAQSPPAHSASEMKDGRSESLSSKLSKSDGVITPNKDVDPGIHAAAPDPTPNSTPVIPPSATGGATAK